MPIQRTFDKTFFKKWSPNMAYILGFLFADGNIMRTKRGTHFVAFYTADLELLQSMSRALGSNHKISERRKDDGAVYVLQIGSKELFSDLVALGLTPNKSKRMRLPDISPKYTNDFIRGYFDGDGNVWLGLLNRTRVKPTSALTTSFTCASRHFLEDLHRELREKGIEGGSIYNIKSKNCCRLSFSTLDSLKIYEIMYTMPHTLFLPRKKRIFEKFIEMRP
jgi:intein-encoded DNA endonuclease-like protein